MTAPAPRTFNIVVLPGDGVGPEVALAAQRVLTCIGDIYGHRFDFAEQVDQHVDLVDGEARQTADRRFLAARAPHGGIVA